MVSIFDVAMNAVKNGKASVESKLMVFNGQHTKNGKPKFSAVLKSDSPLPLEPTEKEIKKFAQSAGAEVVALSRKGGGAAHGAQRITFHNTAEAAEAAIAVKKANEGEGETALEGASRDASIDKALETANGKK